MLEVVYMCKTCVIYGQSRIKEGDIGVVYAAKRPRYAPFTGYTRINVKKLFSLEHSVRALNHTSKTAQIILARTLD